MHGLPRRSAPRNDDKVNNMTDLETYKNQDEVFIEVNKDRTATMIFIAFCILPAPLFINIGIENSANFATSLFLLVVTLLACMFAYYEFARPKAPLKKQGLHLSPLGLEMNDVSASALKLRWEDIEHITVNNANVTTQYGGYFMPTGIRYIYICFHTNNQDAQKLNSKGLLGLVFKIIYGPPFTIKSNRLKIKRDDLYPLIMHFWEKHKNV